MQVFDVWRIREDFPMLKKTMNGKPLIYLDSAATAHKPSPVIQAMERFYAEEYGTVHRAVYELAAHSTEMYTAVRGKIQKFINAAEEEEIIFTRGTTESINLVAHSFGRAYIQAGDEIIISEMEHHSNIVPWQLFCKEHDVTLKFIPMDDNGALRLDVFDEILSEKTKLVSISHIANATGTVNPIKEITKKAHSVGAKVMVDGAQAASHFVIDVQDLDIDFYAFSGHKMYGPTGVGVLYGKHELLEKMPPFLGGGDMIEEVFMDHSTFQEAPLKFEAGTPSIGQVIGLGAAVDYLESIGRASIDAWHTKLLQYATEALTPIKGLRILGTAAEKSSIITFTFEGFHPLDLGTILGLKGIAIRTGHLCAQPTLRHFGTDAAARLSFGIYNTTEEVEHCVNAIQEAAVLLKPEMSY